jgi:hypothetical protein
LEIAGRLHAQTSTGAFRRIAVSQQRRPLPQHLDSVNASGRKPVAEYSELKKRHRFAGVKNPATLQVAGFLLMFIFRQSIR